MANPMGDFVLPVDSAIPLIFIAGGIGCTPFRSIIKELHDKREKRNIRLLHAVRHKEEAAFQDVFGVLGDNYIVLETAKSGPLQAIDILSFSSHNPSCYYYVSGPEPMVEALYSELQKQGVQKNRILGDYFPGYNAP
jgi:ferredoxin-NADP reductase